jgi:hypothetical protein
MKGNAMQLGKTTRSFLALTATGIFFAIACGDGDDNGMDVKDDGVTGGASGTSTGGASGTSTGGASGTSTGGASGMSGAGAGGTSGATTGGGAGAGAGGTAGGASGMGGKAGGGAGGKGGAGAGGMGGKAGGGAGGKAGAGAGGMAGAGMAGAGAGGIAGAGGMAGAGAGGMAGMAPTMLYDFESGVQGWGGNSSQSTTQIKDGAYSLAFAHPALDGTNSSVQVDNPPLWPGTVITVNAWLPVGLDTTGGTYFQMFTNYNNFSGFDNAGNGQRTAQSGAWTTWQYTVPNTFPGGIQRLGFQIGDNSGGTTIPAGNIYIDSITATGGVANCAITAPTVLHDFEAALPADTYLVDGGGNVTVSQSSDRFFGTGAGSLKVSFVDLPAAASTSEPTKRFIYINKPNVYCGQTMTFHVWLPTGSEAMGAQVLSVFNWYSGFAGTGNLTVTRGDWTTGTQTIPTTVDYRGIQRVGIEFSYTGTSPFTGDAYIDQIAW